MDYHTFHGIRAGSHVHSVLRNRFIRIEHCKVTGNIINHESVLPVDDECSPVVVDGVDGICLDWTEIRHVRDESFDSP